MPTSLRNREVGTTISDENFVGDARAENEKIGSVEVPLHFLQRALTIPSETLSYRDPGSPPDQGTKAWLQDNSSPLYPTPQLPNSHTAVLQGHLAIFNTIGYINSYGLFEKY
jgi:hypothetical protein